ncbi:protease inhibitor I9 family protein [Janthinobacterium sp. Mn2066]|uniref:protease inhibitor I9 family protein n=1 Tax=Janthinobacterium sp. Mn2066 TaxID=3395264 RepID=UPI003BED9B79
MQIASEERRAYIVQLTDPPLVSYTVQGRHLETDSEAARRYVGYLEEKQRAVLALIGKAPVQYHYTVTLNGFAAMLTQAEVACLKAAPGVMQVSPDTVEQLNGPALKNNQQ